nr:MAG TPA: hypothetical protein [Caudoviricetes sp.]
MAHITNKELTIRQIGDFCTNTLCKKCPVAKWNEESVSCGMKTDGVRMSRAVMTTRNWMILIQRILK